jgi:hypothetical protein
VFNTWEEDLAQTVPRQRSGGVSVEPIREMEPQFSANNISPITL